MCLKFSVAYKGLGLHACVGDMRLLGAASDGKLV